METTAGIHPAPSEFSEAQIAADPILHFFHYKHLPPQLRETSREFFSLAERLVRTVPRNAERTVALRKLLEAKDAAVRANLPNPAFTDDAITLRNQNLTKLQPELGEPVEIGDAEISVDGGPKFTD